jgi:hypothetical protein
VTTTDGREWRPIGSDCLEAALAGQGLPSGFGHAPDVPARPAPDIQHIVRARGHFGLGGRTGLTERWREGVSAPLVRNGLGR